MIQDEIVVVGSSNMDLVINLPRIPRAGETILGGKSSMIFGGKGANQAVAAIRAGGHVAFISKLGNDIFGHKIQSHFIQEGLPEEFILMDKKEPTGIAQIFVGPQGQNCIAVAPGSNGKLSVKDLSTFETTIKNAAVIQVQLEIPVSTVAYVVKLANKYKVKVILNPAPAQKLNPQVLKKLWLLTPNESEASLLSGVKVNNLKSAQKAGANLLAQGIEQVIITLGENGCLLCTNHGFSHFKTVPVKAIDTTAAGDVFNGALASAVARDLTLDKAIIFANAAAAISVTRHGAQTSIPYLEEIEQVIKKNKAS